VTRAITKKAENLFISRDFVPLDRKNDQKFKDLVRKIQKMAFLPPHGLWNG
jgi:uncharacterized protein YpiB (UPF0302 family)